MSEESNSYTPSASEEPGTSSEPPKKGILKRTAIRNQIESRDTVFPLPGHRPSPDRFPDKPNTKIPKLSVTWWEKNAVAFFGDTSDENNTDSEQILRDLGTGPPMDERRIPTEETRQTAILDSEESNEDHDLHSDQDDGMSMTSSTGSSSNVVGRWWIGKDTRFVPHCQKRGCGHSHSHSPNPPEYVTPTQRRNKELSVLKKELQVALAERDEKDRHLAELRDRVKEIEVMSIAQASLSEGHKQMSREKEAREALERDKKAMEKRHAVRVNQLIQETMAAREETVSLTARVRELEAELDKAKADAGTMTDPLPEPPVITAMTISPSNLPPIDPGAPQCELLLVHSEMDTPTLSDQPQPGLLPPLSLTVDSKGQQIGLSRDIINHIQACQNEAFIWRTKAAQLEIVVKDQLLKVAQYERQIEEMMTGMQQEAMAGASVQDPQLAVKTVETSSFGASPILSMQSTLDRPTLERQSTLASLPPTFECNLASCIERKKNLIEENNKLIESVEETGIRIRELEEDVSALRNEAEQLEEQNQQLDAEIKQLRQDSECKTAEIEASHVVIARLHTEKETMQKAIDYMEGRMQVYQNTLIDHDLIVSDENQTEWRKGYVDPRYSVLVSKYVQTVLTSEELDLNKEFASKNLNMHEKFEEIEQILLTKTQLVDALTKQLEDARREQRKDMDERQTEREEHRKTYEEMAAIAARVPALELRVEELQDELTNFDLKFEKQQEEFEMGLEGALNESLKKYKRSFFQEQSFYWKDKVAAFEHQIDRYKNEIAQLVREKDEQRLEAKVKMADMEQRLTSSIEHVTQLNKRANKSCRDAECEVRPKTINKYVACRPNSKSKSTEILKGDLFDESEERLKLCRGELETTRKQVAFLQQKLIAAIQQRTNERLQNRRKFSSLEGRSTVREDRDTQGQGQAKVQQREDEDDVIEELKERNEQLEHKLTLGQMQERDRIQRLVNEFDNVKVELDQEMSHYQKERCWLQARIENLEKDNRELQKALEVLNPNSDNFIPAQGDAGADANAEDSVNYLFVNELKKSLSESQIDSSEIDKLRLQAENARLQGELDRVRESVKTMVNVTKGAIENAEKEEGRTGRNGREEEAGVQRAVGDDGGHRNVIIRKSPIFSNLANVLSTVKTDLESVLHNLEEPKLEEKLLIGANGQPLEKSLFVEERVEADIAKGGQIHSKVLDTVMKEWTNDQTEMLTRDLKRSREERNSLRMKVDKLKRDLEMANAELQVYRREKKEPTPHEMALGAKLKRSRSMTVINGDTYDKEEAERWKLKAGTMFRELNTLRAGYNKAIEERRQLKIQLAMLRGEYELAKVHMGKTSTDDKVIIHQNPMAFRRGSTHERVICNISVGSRCQSLDRKTNKRMSDSLVVATATGLVSQRRRIHSNDMAEGKDPRRRWTKSARNAATSFRPILSSSMTSLNEATNQNEKLPESMTQSWHSQTAESSSKTTTTYRSALMKMTGSPAVSAATITASNDDDNRKIKVISLREKITRLARENKALQEEVRSLRTGNASIEGNVIVPANEITLNRLNELEREKEALKYQVHQLLGKLQQVRIILYETDNLNFIHFLQVQSILSRVREVTLPFSTYRCSHSVVLFQA
ncbi:hypothetical protein WR25_15085 isoform D [Diploscapter pachys]|uniref:Uncharacterized protein n=1 Tax=Diploscapter pachys TaxID=2018661 RepID=A0A2A2LLD1_9BILA|nr:hypothetical protein WR25_15085 isoform B [Diploscapter pachys]PAV86971.1 hypothetical protein WR25_15085 isoform D [Diploscapter pachys]